MGLFDSNSGGALDPATAGLLSAAFGALSNSGPSLMPRSLGQTIGAAGQQGLNTYASTLDSNRRAAQTQAMVALEQQKAQQSALTTQLQIEKINGFRDMLGLPAIGLPGSTPSQGGPSALPVPGAMGAPQAAPAPQGLSMAPQVSAPAKPMVSRFDAMTAHLPPQQKVAAQMAAASGDEGTFMKILTEGHLKNVQGIGLLQWDPARGDYVLPKAQEEGIAARKQAEQDVVEGSKPDTYTFGTGPNARPVQTTASISNALRTGIAPDEATAIRAMQIANQNGHAANITVRGSQGAYPGATGDAGVPIRQPAPGAPSASPGALQTPQEKSDMERRFSFDKARTETAIGYEKALNEKVSQGQSLDARLDEMARLTKQFRTGGGAEVRKQLAELAQGAQMPTAVVDKIAGGDLGAIQEFEKLQIQGAMESLRVAMTNSAGAGAGRITQAEFQIFLKANPNITLDPRGLEKILNFQKWSVAVDKAEQGAYSNYIKNKDNDPADFPADFAKNRDYYLRNAGISTPDVERKKWDGGGPKVRKYNSATGKIE